MPRNDQIRIIQILPEHAHWIIVSSLSAWVTADPAIYRPTEDSVMRLSREQGIQYWTYTNQVRISNSEFTNY
jgi:hypothetical protein